MILHETAKATSFATGLPDIASHRFAASDGTGLVWHETGAGRPLVLIHGLFSSAEINWIKYGHARVLAEAGFRVIMPDLRAHGHSDKPHDAAAYPPDVLRDDAMALIRHLDLVDYDLGGYSLGGRTVVRMLVSGAAPRRAMILGMGLSGLLDTGHRGAHFRHILTHIGQHERGSPEWLAEAFLKTNNGDPIALNLLLDSFVDTPQADLARIAMPAAIICGEEDDDNGSAEALAGLLPQGRYIRIPGTHMSAVTRREMGRAMRDFLTA